MIPRVICLSFLLLTWYISHGQITIHPSDKEPLTTDNIVENVFLGNGIQIISTTFSGLSGSVGLFDNASSVIGLEKGIVLSTGFAANVAKANSADDPISSNTSGRSYKDLDLEALANVEVVDISKFEITFIPTSDVLRFRYVFASEEYPDFVCADKNDAFGFFITGRNPSGGNYNSENIAKIPDPSDPNMGTFLDLPVTINSVNGGEPGIFNDDLCEDPNESLAFAEYYNPVNPGDTPALNAYLDPFIAQAAVIPCEEYTIKIVIGDGNDQNEDSAVFLEEKSFSTGTISVAINNPGVDGGMAEGCTNGSLRIHIPEATTVDLPLEMEVLSGPDLIDAAIPGIDFLDLPQNNFIPAGSDFLDIELEAIDDDLDEGTEYIYISIRRSICHLDTLIIPLFNNNLETLTLADSIFACEDRDFILEAEIDDAMTTSEIITFNSDAPVPILKDVPHTSSVISVTGMKDIALSPKIIAEICIDSLVHTRLNDLDIYLRAPSDQVLELSTDNGARSNNDEQEDAMVKTCFHVNASSEINNGNATEGPMDLSNMTYTDHYLPEGDFRDWLTPTSSTLNGDYSLFVIDDQGEYDGLLHSWHISFNPKYELNYNWSPSTDLDCPDCELTTGNIDASQYFRLSLEDSYGCTVEDSVWVEITPPATRPEVMCEEISPGTLRFTWTESDNCDFYQIKLNDWANRITTDVPRDVLASFYSVKVIDANTVEISGLASGEEMILEVIANNEAGCRSPSGFADCIASSCMSLPPVVDSVRIEIPVCDDGSDIPVTIYAESDNAPLEYRIVLDNYTQSSDDGQFSNIPIGTWSFRVIDQAGCTVDGEIIVTDPPTIELNPDIKVITCTGNEDGMILLDVQGEAPPFDYRWVSGDTTDKRENLGPGIYTVTVSDSYGCTAESDFILEDPSPLLVSYVQSDTFNCSGSNDVYATLDIEGGGAPYTIEWNGTILTDTLLLMGPGQVLYSVIDSNGCRIDGTEIAFQVEGLSYEFSEIEHLQCYDNENGKAVVKPLYGTPPYGFIWDNGEETDSPTRLHQGLNTVTISDAEGCITIGELTIESPPEIIIEVNELNSPSCHDETDGNITVSASGGMGNFTFLWEDGTTSMSLDGLESGEYNITVTDASGCTKNQLIDLPITQELSLTYDEEPVGCNEGNNGALTIFPIGGSGEYVFQWSGPENFTSTEQNITDLIIGTYTIIISDQKNPDCRSIPLDIELQIASEIGAIIQTQETLDCYGDNDATLLALPSGGVPPFRYEWSNNSNSEMATGLNAGIHSVTITDNENCTAIEEKIIEQPDSISVKINKVDVSCYEERTGSLGLSVEGGTSPYNFTWNTGETSESVLQLEKGEYVVTITDSNNCEETITQIIEGPEAPLIINTEVTKVSCSGGSNGSIAINVENGTEPYRYRLTDTPFVSDSVMSGLSAGAYTVYIEDANGCQENIEVDVDEAFLIDIQFHNEMTVDFGESLQIDVSINNTQGARTLEWQAPNLENFSCTDCPDPLISNITESFSGILMIRDSYGCESEKFFSINVLEDGKIDVPTGFSPNDDQVNDKLIVLGDPSLFVIRFEIYSRWGDLVYSAKNFHPGDESKGWDGKQNGDALPQGSYVWLIECEMQSGRIETIKGQTTLLK